VSFVSPINNYIQNLELHKVKCLIINQHQFIWCLLYRMKKNSVNVDNWSKEGHFVLNIL